jgi:hypothetical protein
VNSEILALSRMKQKWNFKGTNHIDIPVMIDMVAGTVGFIIGLVGTIAGFILVGGS